MNPYLISFAFVFAVTLSLGAHVYAQEIEEELEQGPITASSGLENLHNWVDPAEGQIIAWSLRVQDKEKSKHD